MRACLNIFFLPLFVLELIVVTAGCGKVDQIEKQLSSFEGTNTENYRVWIRKDSHRDKLIVFVHGFNSSNDTAWGQFPSLLKEDGNFEDFNIVLYGYRTKFCSAAVESIQKEGEHLASFLHDIFESKSLKHNRIVLVGHSMGGLVVLHSLRDLDRAHFLILNEQDLRVLSFGTPYLGVENVELLPRFCRNKQTDALEVFDSWLDQLSRDWHLRFNQDIETAGRPTTQVPLYTFKGVQDLFVSEPSACGYGRECKMVDGDHYSVVKPTSRDHLAYKMVLRVSAELPQKPLSTPLHAEREVMIEGVMPVHFREEIIGLDNVRFVDRRLGFIVKALNRSTVPKTVEVVIIDGCVPIDPLFPREAFIDRDLLPEQLIINEDLAALARTAVLKMRTSGAVRADSRVLPPGGVGYVGVLLPLPPGKSGAMMVVEDSASLKGQCSKIPRVTTQPSISQLLKIGPVHYSEPKDIAQSFRDGSLSMMLQVGGKAITLKPSLLGKLYSLPWKTWRSLDLARMYEVPETDYPPTLDHPRP